MTNQLLPIAQQTPRRPRRSLRGRLLCAVLAVLLAATTVLTCLPTQARAAVNYKELSSTEELDDLYANASLGVLGGTVIELGLKDSYPDADLQIFATETDVAAAVAGNKIDYGFVTEFFARRFMESNSGYEYVTPFFMTAHDAFAVAKGNDELREKIDAIIVRMRDEGTLDSIKQKWLHDGNYTMDDVPTCDTGDEVLRVAISATDEPYAFYMDGELAGVAPEIARRVASELGMRVEFMEMTFASEIAAVASGKADIATQLTPTDERKQQVDFTECYTSGDFGALVKADTVEAVDPIQAFKDNVKTTFITENRWQLVTNGLQVTCLITVGAFALGTALAAALCWMSRRANPLARAFVGLYNKLACGVPVLVWLMILYYVVFATVDIPAVVVAILCFGLQSASPISGVFETGLDAVDKGQVEASLAMGFSPFDTFRNIVLPQAAARVWSLYSGQFTALIKATSIVGYIAIQDLTKASDIIRSRTFQAFFPLISTAVVYFLAIVLCGWVFSRLGCLLDPKRRRPAAVLKGVRVRE